MEIFVFDVDGTLTPSRSSMNNDFKTWFVDFVKSHTVYLVTGSDRSKTVEQIGLEIVNSVATCFNCQGADAWRKGTNVYSGIWEPQKDMLLHLEEELANSKFYRKTGKHIEIRQGMLNFSIVGRKANMEDRFMYKQWDEHKNERHGIAERFNQRFGSTVLAKVAGETGLDISPVGSDKSQILRHIGTENFMHFFGDKMEQDGNDYPLAAANKNGKNWHVSGWEETWEILKNLVDSQK